MKHQLLLLLFALAGTWAKAQVNLTIKLDHSCKGPYSGNLFVYTLKDTSQQFTDRSMAAEPAFRLTVRNWTAEKTVNLDKNVLVSHQALNTLAKGIYKLVAILDTNHQERGNSAPGNLYSRQEGQLHIQSPGQGEGTVTLNAVFRERPFRASALVKEVKFPSALLTTFRREPVAIQAAVILPASYLADTARRYPVVFIIPGWGGTHHQGAIPGNQQLYGMGQGTDKIYVYLNPESQTPWGLHAFVDSRVNGPWGKALVEEFIPYLKSTYRISADSKQHFLTGQSSGGYGVVWLALHYPEKFGGTWATSPDPLDFSSFTGVNLYQDRNFYLDQNGYARGLNNQSLKHLGLAEQFAGDGGQQQSFEAEFGLPDAYGRPKPLFDVKTGKINRTVVNDWLPYDLGLYVQQHWPEIMKAGPGPITIYAGGQDNYRLHESVLAFEKKAKAAGANIRIVILPNADHFHVRSPGLSSEMQTQIDQLIKY